VIEVRKLGWLVWRWGIVCKDGEWARGTAMTKRGARRIARRYGGVGNAEVPTHSHVYDPNPGNTSERSD
jgi:hypothetical protein